MDLSYEETDIEEIENDPLNLLQGGGFQIDSPVHRMKRGTTIVHHRVRKRRPKPIRKGRRPPKPRPPKPRPVYGPPPTQIHIHQPNYPPPPSFTSPSGPSGQNHNNPFSNHFAEPPGPSAFSAPSAPPSSVPFIPSSNSIFKKEVTQFQSQQVPPVQPPRQQITQISQQFGIPAQQPPQQSNFYPQGPSIYQNSPNINTQTYTQSVPVLSGPPAHGPINSPSYSQNSNTIVSLSPQKTLTQLVPINNFQSSSNNRIPLSSVSEIPTQSIPLDTSFQGDPYRNTVSSYDVPLNSFNIRQSNPTQTNQVSATQTSFNLSPPQSSINFSPPQNSVNFGPPQSSINFSPPRGLPTTQYEIQNNDFSPSNQPPLLPTRYEPSDFTAIQTKLPDNRFNNAKKTDLFDDSSLEKYLNDVSESKRVNVKTRPEKKRSKPKTTPKPKSKTRPSSGENVSSSFFDDDDEDFSFENFQYNIPTTSTTTTTTKRPKHRRRKRPKVSTTTQHNLDVDDLKDAFESGSEVQEYIVAAGDNANFEPKKYYKLSKRPIQLTKNNYIPISKAPTTKPTTTNYIFVSSPNDFRDDTPKYYTRAKTEKPSRINLPAFTYRPKRVRPTPLQTIYHDPIGNDNSDEVKILSIQKSKSHGYHAGSEKEKTNGNNDFDVGFSFPNMENVPDDFNSFTSGIYLTNGGFGTRIKHGRAKKDMDSEEDYFFEAEYEIALPSNHRSYKK